MIQKVDYEWNDDNIIILTSVHGHVEKLTFK